MGEPMPMHASRRLTFAVGTSLLTASLAATGCAKPHVNTRPPDEPPHVNEGPEEGAPEDGAPEDGAPEDTTAPEEQPDGPNVNTVPSE
jgi:hypothetical protein